LEKRPRFHHPRITGTDSVLLTGAEARHATGARRLRTGCPVEIFDGAGRTRRGVIDEEGRGKIRVRFQSPAEIDPPVRRQLTLALSPARGDRMSFAVEKLSELGCDTIAPVIFRRSLDAGVRSGTGKVERWRRTALESAKQCGRNRVVEIADPIPLAEALALWRDCAPRIVLDCHGDAAPLGPILADTTDAANTFILVGPEGGFTDGERERIVGTGALPARLGDYVLRTETAAVAAAALFRGL
jgi:16S rRNA (uracil1498-N3)-methyltransferase